ncbi:MAG: branched-chain amino acid transaminase [Deltaproteobacteria bacterium]|nr:branched-chain amino acid transaminase [Deltaproteobacteria bacterium]
MEPVVYFEGEFRPESQAKISVRSRALNYGLGCFAGVRGYKTDDGLQVNLFRLERHVQRLKHSARILRMRLPGTVEEVMTILTEVVRRNDIHGDVYIRPLLYANSNELSPILDESQSALTVYCMPLGKYLSAEPIDVCISSWRRIRETALPARTKATGGYLNSALARREAMDNGYTEAIFLTEEGFVSEGSAEHVFILREGTLISPPSTADNLDGITRNTLIALAAELGIPFVERHIGRTELYIADEMFLCGTGAEVTAVRSVDRRVLGDGTRGPLTEKIGKLFDAVVRGRIPERKSWLTPIW